MITAINVPIKQNIDHLFKDDLNKQLIPTIEKICNNMFIQIRESFETGVKECKYYDDFLKNRLTRFQGHTLFE